MINDAAISGMVRDDEGKPLAGAVIDIVGQQWQVVGLHYNDR